MIRLIAAVSALVLGPLLCWAVAFGALRAESIIEMWINSRWFLLACNLPMVVAMVVAIKRRKERREEEARMTPLMRRLPSGVLEL